jgi:hypothetical protein
MWRNGLSFFGPSKKHQQGLLQQMRLFYIERKMIQSIYLGQIQHARFLYPNCRECGASLPFDRWELGLCYEHWRLFTRKDNPKQRRETLEKPIIETNAKTDNILDDISVRQINFYFAIKPIKPKPEFPREKIAKPNVIALNLYETKLTDENSKKEIQKKIKKVQTPKAAKTTAREREEIQRRVELVIAHAREQKASEIKKAKERMQHDV